MRTHQILAVAAISALNFQEVEEFLSGLIFGLTQEDDLPEIQKCLTDGTTLEHEMSELVNDLTYKDIKHIVDAVEVTMKILKESESDLKDCEGMQDDVAKIHQLLSVFDNRVLLEETIYMNCLRNHEAIFKDVGKSMADVGAANYKAFGGDVADLMVQTLTPLDAQPENLKLT